MSSKRVTTSLVAIAALALAVTEPTEAFAPTAVIPQSRAFSTVRWAEETKESAFVPADNAASADDDEESDEDTLAAVEMLGRGAAKVRMDGLFLVSRPSQTDQDTTHLSIMYILFSLFRLS